VSGSAIRARAHPRSETDDYALAIDRHAEVPIGVQLGWALRARIGDGRLVPGQRLPGLRELAETIGVNANTVRAVYQRLEREGLIDSHQGSGTFVASTPPGPAAAGTIAANAAREALQSGVDPREVAAVLYVSSGSPALADELGRRRVLRTQIAALERTLGELEARYPGIAPAPAASRKGPGPTLLGALELEQVRAQLVRRLAIVQAAHDELEGEQTRAKPSRAGAASARPQARGPAGTKAKRAARPQATTRQAKPRPAPA
jgi:DNA-binding transcriptional regulator YhcF (GntR family)